MYFTNALSRPLHPPPEAEEAFLKLFRCLLFTLYTLQSALCSPRLRSAVLSVVSIDSIV